MSNNSVKITKEQVESSGRMRAEQAALHELKPIISSMIDSVRGDDELTITVEVTKATKKGKPDAKANKKPPAKDNSKPSTAKADAKPKADEGKAGKGEGSSADGAGKQEVDPLSDIDPKN